jgi:hypothetical protein
LDSTSAPFLVTDQTTPMNPFRLHLVALLSIYEHGPFLGAPTLRYDGPADWQTELILKSLVVVAKRMRDAEAAVASIGGIS